MCKYVENLKEHKTFDQGTPRENITCLMQAASLVRTLQSINNTLVKVNIKRFLNKRSLKII